MATTRGMDSVVTRAKQLILGMKKYYPNASTSLQIGGTTFTVSELTQSMQDFVNTRDAVEAAQAAAKAKVQTERSQSTSQIAIIRGFEAFVRATFGTKADVLADFGLAPPKVRVPRTAEEKAVSAAKSAATRKARGTMGKNQKKSVKGSITAKLVVTPVTTSPVSPPVATPAPATSTPSAAPAAAAPVGNEPSGAPVATTPPHTA